MKASLAFCLLPLLLALACAPIPIPARDPEAAAAPQPARVGEPVPDFAAIDALGRRIAAADLAGSVVVLTFVSLQPGPSQERSAMIVERLNEVRRRFADRADLRLLVVVLDRDSEPYARGLVTAGLEVLVGPPSALQELAAAFGVTVFQEEEGPVHASETAVLDAGGVVRSIWPGVTSWSLADLLETVARLLSL